MKFIIAICFLIPSIYAAEPIGKIVELKGSASNKISKKSLMVNDLVFEGDELLVNEKSFARVVLNNKVAIQLGQNSDAKLTLKDAKFAEVELESGSVISRVLKALTPEAEPKYQVRTKYASFAVRGTTFFVQAIPNKPTFLCICDGTVAAKFDGKEQVWTEKNHEHPRFFDKDKHAILSAPMGNDHTDAEANELEKFLK